MRYWALQAIEIASGHTREDLETDRLLSPALQYALIVVGEAAGRVSEACQEQYPHIPWGSIIGMRNVLVHGYDKTNLAIVWRAVTSDLPALVADLDGILDAESGTSQESRQ
jgi:uncharacterized protein with HEPN domain